MANKPKQVVKKVNTKPSPVTRLAKKPKDEPLQGEIVLHNTPTSDREAPSNRVLHRDDFLQPVFNDAQLSILLNKTPAWAIKVRQGRGGNYRYIPHGYVTDTLNKAFGFNWDLIIDDIEPGKKFSLMFEEKFDNRGTKIGVDRHISVTGHITVRVMDWKHGEVIHVITKHGYGSSLWLPGQELGDALKSARSDLVKVCAYQLGIGLDLYWDERAEFTEFDVKLKKRQARDLMNAGIPTTPILLISAAMREYKMDGDTLAEVLELDDMDRIMEMSEEEVVAAWERVKSSQNGK